MRCLVCGMELNGADVCPVCNEKVVAVVGNMPEELKEKFKNNAKEKRKQELKNITVFLRSYYWKDENGELVERDREDIRIGQNLDDLEIEQVVWGDTEYARQSAGEELALTVIVKDANGNTKEHTTTVVAPMTESLWKIGCVLKPGFRMVIRVGNADTYADSKEIVLRG